MVQGGHGTFSLTQGYTVAPIVTHFNQRIIPVDWVNLLQSYRAGSINIINIKTGEILCMASTPTYDPNKIIKKPNLSKNKSWYEIFIIMSQQTFWIRKETLENIFVYNKNS